MIPAMLARGGRRRAVTPRRRSGNRAALGISIAALVMASVSAAPALVDRLSLGSPPGMAGSLLRIDNDGSLPELRNAWISRRFLDPAATGLRQNVRLVTEADGTRHGTQGLLSLAYGRNLRLGGDADGGASNLVAISGQARIREADAGSRAALWALHGVAIDETMRQGDDPAMPPIHAAELSAQAHGDDGSHREGIGARSVLDVQAKGWAGIDPPPGMQTGHEVGTGINLDVAADKSADQAGTGAHVWGYFRRAINIDGVRGVAEQVQRGLAPYGHKIGIDIGMVAPRDDDGIAAIRIHAGSQYEMAPRRARIAAELPRLLYGVLFHDGYRQAAISLPSGQAIEWRRPDGSTVRLTHNPETDRIEVDGAALDAVQLAPANRP